MSDPVMSIKGFKQWREDRLALRGRLCPARERARRRGAMDRACEHGAARAACLSLYLEVLTEYGDA